MVPSCIEMVKTRGYMPLAKRSNWETPVELFDYIDRQVWYQYGQRIVLDVCADKTNTKCRNFYAANALERTWHHAAGYWFCNPPYGRGIRTWIRKGIEERAGVFLLPARTDVRWFHDYLWNEAQMQPREGIHIRFLRGRVKFVGADASAPFPSMVAYIGRTNEKDRR